MPKRGTQFQSTSASQTVVAPAATALSPRIHRTSVEHEVERCSGKRDPARQLRAPARGEPGKYAGDERNDDEPDEHHENTTIARNSTDPTAIPAAYQRTSPVCVSWRARYKASVRRARPV